jgi:dipeptidyl aminopeptidase/acylaminoacyl peptidase
MEVAWISYEKGLRNIFLHTIVEAKPIMLTHFSEDDGQELTGLQWSPDGKHISFIRGGAPNRRGEIPNPRSVPDGASRSIWAMNADGSNQRILAEGAGPQWAPDSQSIAYVSKGQVYRIGLGEEEADVLFKARGGINSLRWSPDGTYLAFVSSRGTHSYVGLYDLRHETIKWLDASMDEDTYPSWSADGRYIAFIRFPTESDVFIFSPRRDLYPWSIRIYDTDLHQGRELWRADEGKGSGFWNIVSRNQLIWMGDNTLVFPWEKDGWNHLYSMGLNDTKPTLLTPGEFEVEFADISPDKKTVVFGSNQDDINRRHLWKISSGDTRPTAVTKGESIEWAPSIMSDNDSVACLRSDALTHAHPTSFLGNGVHRGLFRKEEEREYRLVKPESVTFKSPDGMLIHAQVFLPPDYDAAKKYPAAMFYHGGSRRQMLLGFHKSQYYHNAYGMNQYLANKGVITMSVNYRSGIGYGMEFREALEYGATGASEYRDVLGATIYLRGRKDIDKDRIAIWGGSYGGYLTGLGLARNSELFVCGVDIHGVHNWNVCIKNFIPSYEPLKNPERTALAFKSSPMADVATWKSPVLLIHGDDDRNVPFSESTTLVEELRKNDVHFEQLVFPDEVHGFLLHSNWMKAYDATAEFLLRHLKPHQ